jgi:uncharacterized membrane protein SirB2
MHVSQILTLAVTPPQEFLIVKMCFKTSKAAMAMGLPQNKEKLTKAIINIIKKLKISSGAKREKYMNMVRNEFNLEKNEKWVITKLRMMLVRLDAGLELLQIRKSESTKAKKRQYVAKEVICVVSSTNLQSSKSGKGTNLAVLKPEQSTSRLEQSVKVKTSKQIKTAKKARKSLECRQLEKLRNLKFENHEESLNNPENKAAFLRAFNLEPQVIFL